VPVTVCRADQKRRGWIGAGPESMPQSRISFPPPAVCLSTIPLTSGAAKELASNPRFRRRQVKEPNFLARVR
jgi:hypothetical protein